MALNNRQPNMFGHHPWFMNEGIDEFFSPSPFFRTSMLEDLVPVFPDGSKIVMSSPGYHVNETDGQYQIAVDVPGVRAEDISVNLEHEGRLLHISGGRKITKEDTTTESKFDKRFTLGKNIDVEKMTANLADGVLTLTAPKKAEPEKKVLKIHITEGMVEDKKKET